MNKTKLTLLFSITFLVSGFFFSSKPKWVKQMEYKIPKLAKKFDGDFGVYIEDMNTGESYGYKAKKSWYLCSATKIPVAIALLKMVDAGEMKLTEKVVIQKEDYRDGAGPVNYIKPGDPVSYRYLLKNMIIYSDNAATDLIIKRVGLDRVNKVVAEIASKKEFGPITSLLEVRKKAYSNLHPQAKKLDNFSYLAIKKARTPTRRVAQLAKELKIPQKELQHQDYSKAFETYYSQGWNSSTLISYAEVLRRLDKGELLSKKSTKRLKRYLIGVQTGKKRVRKGLTRNLAFAHKTGTQHKRACDMGIITHRKDKSKKIMLLICTSGWKSLKKAEKLMEKVGRILTNSELLKK